MHRIYLLVLFFISFTVITGCEKVDDEKMETEKTDNLNETGLIGQWKLEARSLNNISDLSVECCDYIEFKTDDDSSDLKGAFIATGVGYETKGDFELKPSDNIIQFNYEDSEKVYEYQMINDLIIFTYVEEGNEVVEDWRKL
ncbi:hypothetical protein [Halocola ammonii]